MPAMNGDAVCLERGVNFIAGKPCSYKSNIEERRMIFARRKKTRRSGFFPRPLRLPVGSVSLLMVDHP
ncbi:hypothetical protein HKK52_30575 [Pseudomonas sp. ADAK2]|uniref:hypothetical protein n=1 Tax=unclassified Pseudomonas TaxID=196821 RepID=UPI001463C9C2|nr:MULTISPECIES: hypothetical protein [unclassified Pseudomonas]QJI39389.1 hypothetical protein HKK53_30575 [Pseudomonas sp. ADAK7]QJI45695.1 hypothetical protein HKK52_30575 [Pseudomonas sp. ADAK2]